MMGTPAPAETIYDERRGTVRAMGGTNLSEDLERDAAFRALQTPGREAELAIAFVTARRDVFRLAHPADELKLTRVDRDALGMRHVRLRQVHEGLPIHAAELIVHLDRDGHVTSVNGSYVRTPTGVATKPTIDASRAARRAADAAGAKKDQAGTPSLAYWAGDDGRVRLAYRVAVNRSAVDAQDVWIDARSGAVLARIPTAYPISPGPTGGFVPR